MIYGEATVAVERECSADETEFVRGLDVVGKEWRIGVMFGLLLLRRNLMGLLESRDFSVTITSFRGVPCDTTLPAAAFVAFHAAAKALGVDISEVFTFDDSTGTFQISLRKLPNEPGPA